MRPPFVCIRVRQRDLDAESAAALLPLPWPDIPPAPRETVAATSSASAFTFSSFSSSTFVSPARPRLLPPAMIAPGLIGNRAAPAVAASSWASTRARLLAIEKARAARLATSGAAAGISPEAGGAAAAAAVHNDVGLTTAPAAAPAAAAAAPPPTAAEAFDMPTCTICLEDLPPPGGQLQHDGSESTDCDGLLGLTLPCRHRFHAACLDSAFEGQRNTCPLCRAPAFSGGSGLHVNAPRRDGGQPRRHGSFDWSLPPFWT
jgi:hypothetical protein